MTAQPSRPRVLLVRSRIDADPVSSADAAQGLVAVAAAKANDEALEMYREAPADLVLVDAWGRDAEAFALVEALRAMDPEALVVVAASCDVAGALEAFGVGAEPPGGAGFGGDAVFAMALREAAARRRSRHWLRRIAALASQGRRETAVASARALNNALEARDPATGGHSERVAAYADLILARLPMTEEARAQARIAAQLHDIGKIGVRDDVLLKAARLSPEEQSIMRAHPVLGARILEPLGELAEARLAVRHHHERWDGAGYPDGLAGDAIPPAARALFIADAFDAMTSNRSYSQARGFSWALEEIMRCAGMQFDPRMAAAFVEAMSAGEAAAGAL